MIPLSLSPGHSPARRSADGGRRVLHDLQVVHTAGLRHWRDVEGLADTAPQSTGSAAPKAVSITGWQRLVSMLLALTTTVLAGADPHLLVFGLVPLAVIAVISVARAVRDRRPRTTMQAGRS
jgi:hypothetical protein